VSIDGVALSSPVSGNDHNAEELRRLFVKSWSVISASSTRLRQQRRMVCHIHDNQGKLQRPQPTT
jgi:hypothetical protein